MMGPTIHGCRGPRKPLEQGRHSSDVLAYRGEVWEGFIVLDDSSVHDVGHGTCTPTISVVLDLSIELRAFLLESESRFLELLVSGLYPLHL